MENHELAHGVRFEVIVTHDAEDIMHPESLRWINWFSESYDMVQIPVLPLPTPAAELTHGLYCDEFAEYQSKDIPVRQRLGGFLPSNGVGCGFSRRALDRLARERQGMVFDPESLTEDYETGYLLHTLGFPQLFVPLRFESDGPVATREYFPRTIFAALRQRSRWVSGITLQAWQRHGWRAPWRQVYWLWRDRKGLVGNLLTPFINGYLVYVIAEYIQGRPPYGLPFWLGSLTVTAAAGHIGVRTILTGRIYGWRFAAAAPLRILLGNLVNFLATSLALIVFVRARLRRRRLSWMKTDHTLPTAHNALQVRPRIGEVLVRLRCLSTSEVQEALGSRPAGVRLGEHLMQLQRISEEDLYHALSIHAGIPGGVPRTHQMSRTATRALPVAVARRWSVLPYRVAVGALYVLTADVPSEQMARELARASRLEIRFRLVRPADLKALSCKYLPEAVA
jgi:adsorption protein B